LPSPPRGAKRSPEHDYNDDDHGPRPDGILCSSPPPLQDLFGTCMLLYLADACLGPKWSFVLPLHTARRWVLFRARPPLARYRCLASSFWHAPFAACQFRLAKDDDAVVAVLGLFTVHASTPLSPLPYSSLAAWRAQRNVSAFRSRRPALSISCGLLLRLLLFFSARHTRRLVGGYIRATRFLGLMHVFCFGLVSSSCFLLCSRVPQDDNCRAPFGGGNG
jgi:hypothetical protein